MDFCVYGIVTLIPFKPLSKQMEDATSLAYFKTIAQTDFMQYGILLDVC